MTGMSGIENFSYPFFSLYLID